MLRYKLFSVLILCLVFISCHSNGTKTKTDTSAQAKDTVVPVAKEKFQTGVVIDNVVNNSDAGQSYALYLPGNYSIEKTYPVVYCFDAHGTGKLPVDKYKELAEKYGFILVGSNNSKNGNAWETSSAIAEKLFADVQTRIAVNTKRAYLLGFSGGARVANGLTITNGAISGAICCGAAAPGTNSANPRNDYTFLGIGGTADFNYTEIKKYCMVDLAGHNVKHAMLSFDGKHEWPPVATMDEAFWWLELGEMRKTPAYKNDSLIKKHITPDLKQIDALIKKKQTFEAFELCKKTITFYDMLTDLTSCFALYKTLNASPEIDKALRDEEVGWAKEDQLKQYYLKNFESGDFARWQVEINQLNQKIKNGKDKAEVLIDKRVLDYLSLAAYMQASGAVKQNNIQAAQYFCKIYVLVDPTNNEAHYLTAYVNAKLGDTKGAIASLNMAVKNGYSDLPRLQADSSFISVRETKEFQEVVNKIK